MIRRQTFKISLERVENMRERFAAITLQMDSACSKLLLVSKWSRESCVKLSKPSAALPTGCLNRMQGSSSCMQRPPAPFCAHSALLPEGISPNHCLKTTTNLCFGTRPPFFKYFFRVSKFEIDGFSVVSTTSLSVLLFTRNGASVTTISDQKKQPAETCQMQIPLILLGLH
jgi:hypothetical protein